MSYIFKQKFQLSDLTGLENKQRKILIYEPQGDLAALYAHYLSKHNFDIEHCNNLSNIRQSIINFNPLLLIFSIDAPEVLPKISLVPGNLIKEFPNLNIISTGYNLSGQGLGELMTAGIASHINRKLSRPQDLVVVINTILQA